MIRNLASGDPKLIQGAEVAPDLFASDLAFEETVVFGDGVLNLLRRFVHELDAEFAGAERLHVADVFSAGLSARIEDCVAATRIGL